MYLLKQYSEWKKHIWKFIQDTLGIIVITIISCLIAALPTLLVLRRFETRLETADATILSIVLYLIITFIITGLLTNGMFVIYRKCTWLKADIIALHAAVKFINYLLDFSLSVLVATILGVLPLIYNYYELYISSDNMFLFSIKIKYSGIMYFWLSMAALLKICLQRELKVIEHSKKNKDTVCKNDKRENKSN